MLTSILVPSVHAPSAHEKILAGLLRDYYMGELCPPEPVLRGFFDSDFYDSGLNPSTYHREFRDVVDCVIVPCEFFGGEPSFAAYVTSYLPGYRQFCSSIEYWPQSAVEKFSILISK